ncbi:tetratricopeptide repeat protein [bacterium]|nr:tetratricopeptide repeat protein [bacterium]
MRRISTRHAEVLKGENKTELAKYSGFIDLIEKDEKTLFLDNFQSITGNSFEELLKFTEKRLKKARVILVSREHLSFSVKFVPIELHGLGDEALWYAQRFKDAYYRTLQVSEDDLKDICSTLAGHPLAIELALQLLSYGESPKNIIQRIVRAKDKSRELSDRLLDEVFNHPKSTVEEKELLLCFSLFRAEIDREGISFLFDGGDISSTLYKLIDKKMVSVANALYRTHPLIREFCYQRLSDKEAAHEKAASYFEMRRTNQFDPFLEEEIFYHIFSSKNQGRTADFISDTGDNFILLGHTNSLIEMINKALAWGLDRSEHQVFLGDIATLRGEWDDASRHFEEAFSSKDADDRITAEAYIKFGEILYRKGEVREALKYFEDAHARCKRYGYKKEHGRSANDIGLVFLAFGDFQEAERWLSDGQDVREAIDDKVGIANSLSNIGWVLHAQGDLQGALQRYKESLKISEGIGDKAGIANSLNNIGLVLYAQGDLPGALQRYKESLKISEEIGDKSGIATSLSYIGDIWRSKKNYPTALECFLKSFALQDRIGVDKNPTAGSISQIRRKFGLKKFRKIFQVAYDSLAKDLQTHVHLEEFTEDKTVVRGSEKVGRNDPCPCGSGK